MENKEKKYKICGISTLPVTLKTFMLGNLNYVTGHGFDSYCISQYANGALSTEMLGNVKYIPVNIKWGYVSPIEAIKTIYRLYKVFKKEKFDVIQYATFNASFCSSIAGWLAGVPVRINLQWGLSYASVKGWQHYFRRTVCLFSTSVQPDSKTNLQFAISDHLYPARKGCVIYNGSACGVDLQKFDIEQRQKWSGEVKKEYRLEKFERIFGFVGRVIPEKGINEMLEAFMSLENAEKACLVVVGPTDRADLLDKDLYEKAKQQENIVFTGGVANPAKYYAAFDYMILPSYQEGFGMTVLEAAAVGTPSIITNIKGPTDFIKDDFNGMICEVRSAKSLQETMRKAMCMLNNEYRRLADNAYKTVKEDFDSKEFKKKFLANRLELLKEKNSKKNG